MRPIARVSLRRFFTAGVLLVSIPMMLSGCIVCIEDIFCNTSPPRAATLYVYARDYYTGAPIPWAEVELYERDWWSWDYQGSWSMNPSGYAAVHCGYFYHDGCGGDDEEDFRVVVRAPGYCSERYEIELSYYYPSETLTFYLAPCAAREDGDAESGSRTQSPGLEGAVTPETDQPAGKVVVGESGQAGDE
jgi:hypothetical protein